WVSSRSSAPESSVRALLARSFDALAAELPEAYARLGTELAGWPVEVEVDRERFVIRVVSGRLVTDEGEAPVRIRASKAVLLAIVDARETLVDAVRADAIELRAPRASLGDLHEAWTTYLHGAARCPSFPLLLARFRALCHGSPAEELT